MRILILSFYFETDLSAGSFRMTGLVQALGNNIEPEDQIDILTTQPNRYASYSEDALKEEFRDRVTIKRFDLPAHRSGFVDQSFAFFCYAYKVIKATRSGQYDLVFATSSRLCTAALGAIVASRMRALLYLDIRDIFVDTLKDVLSPIAAIFILPILRLIERSTVSKATHVNLVSAGFLEYFSDRYPNTRYSVIPNGIDNVFLGVDYTNQSVNTKTIVLYAGNIGEGQGLTKIIPNLANTFRLTHEFWIVGDGGQRLELENEIKNLSNVKMILPVSRKDLIDLYRCSDILFLHLNDYPAFHKVLPSKLFEYAATGKPIVAGVSGHAAAFIQQIPGAVSFPPCLIEAGIVAIRDAKLGIIFRQDFIKRFRRTHLMQELATDLIEVAKGRVNSV